MNPFDQITITESVTILIPTLFISQAEVLGPDLVTNGGFTGSAAGWTFTISGWTYGTNNLISDGSRHGEFYQDIGAVAGTTYRVSFDIAGSNGGFLLIFINGYDGVNLFSQAIADGSYLFDIEATASGNHFLEVIANDTTESQTPFAGSITNIVVKELISQGNSIGEDIVVSEDIQIFFPVLHLFVSDDIEVTDDFRTDVASFSVSDDIEVTEDLVMSGPFTPGHQMPLSRPRGDVDTNQYFGGGSAVDSPMGIF